MVPQVLIFGTGSVGTVYAYIFSRIIPTSNIVTVCRSNYAAAFQHGFTINSTLWGDNLNFKPTVVRTVEEAAELDRSYDYVIVCAKALVTTPSLAELIAPVVSEGTCIVLIQNGISIENQYHTMFPNNTLLSTVVYLPVTQTSSGIVSHKEVELLHVGTFPTITTENHKKAASVFVDLLTSAGATARLHDDIQFERWSKLLINASWNPICALSRSRDVYFMMSSPESHSYVRKVMLEIAHVAQACGYAEINDKLVDYQISRASARSPPGVEPSMMADALVGRHMEVEAIVGNVLREAQRLHIDTPLLESLYFLTTALDSSFNREMI